MTAVYFLAFVVACVLAIAWFAHKSNKKNAALAAKQKAKARNQRTDHLRTPSSYLLANRDHVWQKKRQNAAEDVIITNRFVPRSKSGGEPEYDGFSRRDRHHVVVGTAHIKKEDGVEEPSMTTIEYKEGKANK